MRRWLPAVAVVAAACSHAPPADFTPDPALLDQIREIRISVTPTACPGETFGANYSALLNDGTAVPFEARYDKKHPPRLHVVFLERTSSDATPLQNGSWTAASDPFWTVRSGFRLRAALKYKPSITTTADVSPEYNCLPHTFAFEGSSDEDGPDVTVRLGIARSPFFERLLVASIQVGDAPPFYGASRSSLPAKSRFSQGWWTRGLPAGREETADLVAREARGVAAARPIRDKARAARPASSARVGAAVGKVRQATAAHRGRARRPSPCPAARSSATTFPPRLPSCSIPTGANSAQG